VKAVQSDVFTAAIEASGALIGKHPLPALEVKDAEEWFQKT
jgi:hypothetical protein